MSSQTIFLSKNSEQLIIKSNTCINEDFRAFAQTILLSVLFSLIYDAITGSSENLDACVQREFLIGFFPKTFQRCIIHRTTQLVFLPSENDFYQKTLTVNLRVIKNALLVMSFL